ncbi:MAG TPA: BspA family leucine-rich repeat surface protein [Ruminococcus sp.]|nr:BspA family leucine-rich repeat surface protein [Ruminococcus sp.]
MKGIRKMLAAFLALTLIGGAAPFEAGSFDLSGISLTAQAEDAGSTATLDETTGVLTLSGNIKESNRLDFKFDKRVKSVVAAPGAVLPKDCLALFYEWEQVESIDLSQADSSNVVSTKQMFYGCSSLTSLDLSGFNTSKITNMESMFYGCSSLTSLDVSGFDTSKVTNMQSMFRYCISLESLDLSNFETSNVTDMSNMFRHCKSLTLLDLSSFDTSSVTNMERMFYDCSSLTTIYASDKWNTDNVTLSFEMFYNCTDLVGGIGTAFNSSKNYHKYARIDTPETPGYLTMFKYDSIDYSSFRADPIVFTGELPYPGSTVKAVGEYHHNNCNIDLDNTGWYDAKNERFLEEGEIMQYNGSYIYRVRLTPDPFYYFTEPTIDELEKLQIAYGYNINMSFMDTAGANLNDDGSLDIYAVPKKNAVYNSEQILLAPKVGNYYHVPSFTVCVRSAYLEYGVPVRSLPGVYESVTAMPDSIQLNSLAGNTLTNTYLYNVVAEGGYEVSFGGGSYVDLRNHDGRPFTGLKPSTDYTMNIRLKGASEPFYTETFRTADSDDTDGYITDSTLSSLEFKHNCSFQNDLSMYYAVPKESLSGYSNIRLEVTKEEYTAGASEPTFVKKTLTSYKEQTIGGVVYYMFTFDGITSTDMGSTLTASLLADKNGVTYSTKPDKYSIKDYAMDRIQNSSSATFKKMLVDMLNYGAAAQVHFDKNAAHLANSDLTAAQKKMGTQTLPTLKNAEKTTAVSGATATFDKKNVSFENKTVLMYRLKFATGQNMANVKLKLTYKTSSGTSVTKTIPASQFTKSGSYYIVSIDSIAITDVRSVITAKIYDGSKQISNTFQYSIESYVYNRLNNSDSETFKNLVTEMMKFGISAEEHFS